MNYGFGISDSLAFDITIGTFAAILLLLSLPTIIVNVCIIHAIIHRRELQRPSFLLVANLALSDCLAGAITYTGLSTLFIRLLSGEELCQAVSVLAPLGYTFTAVTFLNSLFQILDRYFATFKPFKYSEMATKRRMIYACIVAWTVPFIMTATWFATGNKIYNQLFMLQGICIGLALEIICYTRIIREVKRMEATMNNMLRTVDENFKIESKITKATAMIVGVIVLSFLPSLVMTIWDMVVSDDKKGIVFVYANYTSWIFALLNSFLNPIISCTQLSVLRNAVQDILKAICCKHRVKPQLSGVNVELEMTQRVVKS